MQQHVRCSYKCREKSAGYKKLLPRLCQVDGTGALWQQDVDPDHGQDDHDPGERESSESGYSITTRVAVMCLSGRGIAPPSLAQLGQGGAERRIYRSAHLARAIAGVARFMGRVQRHAMSVGHAPGVAARRVAVDMRRVGADETDALVGQSLHLVRVDAL